MRDVYKRQVQVSGLYYPASIPGTQPVQSNPFTVTNEREDTTTSTKSVESVSYTHLVTLI